MADVIGKDSNEGRKGNRENCRNTHYLDRP